MYFRLQYNFQKFSLMGFTYLTHHMLWVGGAGARTVDMKWPLLLPQAVLPADAAVARLVGNGPPLVLRKDTAPLPNSRGGGRGLVDNTSVGVHEGGGKRSFSVISPLLFDFQSVTFFWARRCIASVD